MVSIARGAPLKDWSRATYEDEEDELACNQAPLAVPVLEVSGACGASFPACRSARHGALLPDRP